MLPRNPILIVVLSVLGPSAFGQNPLLSYTDESSNGLAVELPFVHAQAFDLAGPSLVSEIQLNLWRSSGSTGQLGFSLCRDNQGKPGAVLQTIVKDVTEFPLGVKRYEAFLLEPPVQLNGGKYWFRINTTTGSDARLHWVGNPAQGFQGGGDTKTSKTAQLLWDVIQGIDMNFRLFVSPVTFGTNTSLAFSRSKIPALSSMTVTVTVMNGGSNIPGPGVATLSATAGTLKDQTVELTDGVGSTIWTAPDTLGSESIQATFTGSSYAGSNYQGSAVAKGIVVVQSTLGTDTTIDSFAPDPVSTYSTATVTVSVEDQNQQSVDSGSVVFDSDVAEGSFSPNPADVSNGTATTTWTTPSTVTGSVSVQAEYCGDGEGAVIYGPSFDTQSVTVNPTVRPTQTSVEISPSEAYVTSTYAHRVFVRVRVTDLVTGAQVAGGTITMSTTSGGSFSQSALPLIAGEVEVIHFSPTSSIYNARITASYPETVLLGYRYQASSGDSPLFDVLSDPDLGSLRLLGEWIEDYPTDEWDLDHSAENYRGFRDVVTDFGFVQREMRNDGAKPDHFRPPGWPPGDEDAWVDARDLVYYVGHGHADKISFQGYIPESIYCFQSDTNETWGDKDLEWMIFNSCNVLTENRWASSMDGVHLLLGARTVMWDLADMGKDYAGLLVQRDARDYPFTHAQAWQTAFDWNMDTDQHPRILAEHGSNLDDYLWGQGPVSADPAVDNFYVREDEEHQINLGAVVDLGGPYNPVVGVPFSLDGTDTTHALQGEYMIFAWDLDTNVLGTGNFDGGQDLGNDDVDALGPRPTVTFNTSGQKTIRLMVKDSHGILKWGTKSVDVVFARTGPGAPPGGSAPFSSPLIVDNTGGVHPPEAFLPSFDFTGDQGLAYQEMQNIGLYWGMTGPALDDDGIWSWSSGPNRLFVSEDSGGVNYLDMTRAYRWNGPPPGLPPDAVALGVVQNFMVNTGIVLDNSFALPVMTVNRATGDKDEPTPTTDTPFLKRVVFRRAFDVGGTSYPAVGPGGKVEALVDPFSYPVYFLKIWRDVVPGTTRPLVGAPAAISAFVLNGHDALDRSLLPVANSYEIESIGLGYYEDAFGAHQSTINPVYVMQVKCIDDVGMVTTTAYLPAVAAPVEAQIDRPASGTSTDCRSVTLAGSSQGGVPPYTYEWSSDRSGVLGQGPKIDVRLSKGLHTIRLEVTDSDGALDTHFIQVRSRCPKKLGFPGGPPKRP